MIKKIICLSLVLLMLFLFAGCTSTGMDRHVEVNSSMFVIVEGGIETYYQIVYHKDTKVMYAVSRGGYNQGTFTLMVDAEGKPLLYSEN